MAYTVKDLRELLTKCDDDAIVLMAWGRGDIDLEPEHLKQVRVCVTGKELPGKISNKKYNSVEFYRPCSLDTGVDKIPVFILSARSA